ncbi:synaptopodin 2-like protein [Gastrophryne carolinensis]
MGNDDHILITLSGEGPWGFRLNGGSEKSLPLLVSKVRKRSKACRGGLRENDELISINGKPCVGLAHAEAMQMIDSSGGSIHIRVKRAASGAQTPRSHRAYPSPSSPNAIRSPEPPTSWGAAQSNSTLPGQPRLLHLESITSPPDSEAYYGETDSDADVKASSGHLQSAQQHHSQQQQPAEKHRRARKKSPRSPPGSSNKVENEQQSLSEMSGNESGPGGAAEGVIQPTSGVAKREITYQPDSSRAETPFSDVEGFLPDKEPDLISNVTDASPESLLLPHASKNIRAERYLIPMIGPVEHPVDEDLTTSYLDKAKEAKLHRSESVQEKNVKEAQSKCKTIASLLTAAPNPHSKGVLMFKKRRQRAKKYTLVSYGSVDEDQYNEDEDGVLPTSESEFDEEGFSDARSLTNNSDWDSTYLDIEKPKMEQEHIEEKGLSEASGKGAALFELQRQKSEKAVDNIPVQILQAPQKAPVAPPRKSMVNGHVSHPAISNTDQGNEGAENTKMTSAQISLAQLNTQIPQGGNVQSPGESIFNRSARPFTPGQVGQRTSASSVLFNPMPPKKIESSPVQSVAPTPFIPYKSEIPSSPQMAPVSSVASLYIPAPGTPRTTTASIFLSSPSRPPGPPAVNSQSDVTGFTPTTPMKPTTPQFNNPAVQTPSYMSPIVQTPESVSSREQKISVPAGRTGILNEARKRGGRKQMFAKKEEKKYQPNPELLSMVQHLCDKPKQEPHVAGFESGPEEDFLSLGAEACNFMQSSLRKSKVPPPVAPKPILKNPVDQYVNGCQDQPQLKGKGAELFAKRQSRMDKFVVDSERKSYSRPNSRPRTPSPTPSLPSSWKYSSNIRAPPPIAYNPLVSPFYPLAASKSQGAKVESKVKKGASGKQRMQAIDFMSHQPYQLNPAMFCFNDSSGQDTQKTNLPVTPGRQVPVKTRAYEIKRFSTPTPMSSSVNITPTVLTPRSATTLAEPVWRTEMAQQYTPSNAAAPAPYQPPVLESPRDTNRATAVLSPTSSFISPRASASRIQVPKPRFSAAKTGMQANVWRPARVHF